jgi:NADP-dependent 3-hydroxy acid dehydrogenase YdfG
MGELKDQLAVVTGASSGIGRAIALALSAQGAELGLVSRRKEALETVANEIRDKGAKAYVCCADFTREEDLRGLAERLDREFGHVDVLVLCGGAISHGSVERAPLADFDLMYHANLRGQYALIQLLLPLLRKRPGQIVFINSSAGLRSPANVGQFSATQHALRSIADTLRDEVNADGIRVVSVYPGRTATPRMAALFAKEGKTYRPELLLQAEDIASMVTHSLCLPRTAEVTDISIRPMLKSY